MIIEEDDEEEKDDEEYDGDVEEIDNNDEEEVNEEDDEEEMDDDEEEEDVDEEVNEEDDDENNEEEEEEEEKDDDGDEEDDDEEVNEEDDDENNEEKDDDGSFGMGEVFVVDSQATPNLVPPKQRNKGTYLLYTLLGLALFGVVVEGVLIYRLYQRISTQIPPEAAQHFKQIGENNTRGDAYSKEISPPLPTPKTDDTKPAAFLHYNHFLKSDVMQWNFQGFPTLMHHFNYSNGSLIIPKDGFYYIFSKVSFKTCSIFKHEVKLNSSRYSHRAISFMTDMRCSCVEPTKSQEKGIQFSSYMGGVLKLYKTDKVFVSVSNHSNLTGSPSENFFGGFMI
ncbi:hypothetical protein AMELA_G00235210 [Ameiurus melas]|uniref:THD domain-containing protein n=1 Tax=Ameiurus melas TaxID=219545 RepID=A0A7J6A227_AMEME|nr:hypothetical protein AMELA_G00235210 [Ameiurus melas]